MADRIIKDGQAVTTGSGRIVRVWKWQDDEGRLWGRIVESFGLFRSDP